MSSFAPQEPIPCDLADSRDVDVWLRVLCRVCARASFYALDTCPQLGTVESIKAGLQRAVNAVGQTVDSAKQTLDPLRTNFEPLQRTNAQALNAYRMARSVVNWDQPVLTMWLLLALLALAFVLSLLPLLVGPRLLRAGAHGVTLAVLGPHNYIKRRRRERRQVAWAARIAEYAR